MSFVIARFSEPSTWAGVSAILSILANTAQAASMNLNTAGIIAAVSTGAIAIVKRESRAS